MVKRNLKPESRTSASAIAVGVISDRAGKLCTYTISI